MFNAIVRTMFVHLLNIDDIPVLSNQNGDLVVKEERLFCSSAYSRMLQTMVKKIRSHVKHLKCTFDGAFRAGGGEGGIEVEFECMAHN